MEPSRRAGLNRREVSGIDPAGKSPPILQEKNESAQVALRWDGMGSDVKYTIDHDVIRKWVEARGGWPAKFRRIYFSRYVTRGVLPRVRWEEFFQTFEEQRLAFLYQEHTATGRLSHFFRFVSRRAEDAGDCSPPLESSMPQAEDIPAIVHGGVPQRIDGGSRNAMGP